MNFWAEIEHETKMNKSYKETATKDLLIILFE